jgi:hypothetical protein
MARALAEIVAVEPLLLPVTATVAPAIRALRTGKIRMDINSTIS